HRRHRRDRRRHAEPRWSMVQQALKQEDKFQKRRALNCSYRVGLCLIRHLGSPKVALFFLRHEKKIPALPGAFGIYCAKETTGGSPPLGCDAAGRTMIISCD